MTLHTITNVIRVAVALIFATAAISKLVRPRDFLTAIQRYAVLPRAFVMPGAIVVLAGELFVVGTHVSGRMETVGEATGVSLLGLFALVVSVTLARNRQIPCGCFTGDGQMVSVRTLLRIGLVVAAEVFLLALPSWAQYETASLVDLQSVTLALILIQVGFWLLSLPELVQLFARLAARWQPERVAR